MLLLALSALTLGCVVPRAVDAQSTEPRLALVIGNAGYAPGALPTALNDAGLVAEALRSIGFEIMEGGDLSQPDMLRLMRDFLSRVEASGPDTLAFIYFSGHGVAFEGENYLLGVDARLARESEIPIQALQLSDLLRPLSDSPARAKVVMIDAMRPLPFRPQGQGLAPGLVAVGAPDGMLIAYASAPGTVTPDGQGPYGAYATAIAEMLRAPGVDLENAFTQIRTRTHQMTEGQQTPWNVSNLGDEIELVPPGAATADAPPPPPRREVRPMRALDPDEAYALAIEQDSLDRYVEFVEVYPESPYSERVWAMIRARREALAWMRALELNSREAYWTYLRRYPEGIYAYDAQRRLRRLSAPLLPPVGFALLAFAGVPLALRNEPRQYRPPYRLGPPPPQRFMRPPARFLANLPPPASRRAAPGTLPRLTAPIPVIPNLAPAPRRTPAGAGRPPRDGAPGTVRRTPPGGPAPAFAPSTAPGIATTPPPGASPQRSGRPPGAIAPPGVTRPGATPPSTTAPAIATTPPAGASPQRPGATLPPPSAPSTASPSPPARPSQQPGRPGVRPPGSPPGTAVRTPPPTAPGSAAPVQRTPPPPATVSRPPAPPPARPAAPPPAAVARPSPPPPARPAPAARPAAPPPPRVAAPPPARPAPPAARPAPQSAKPPACPAGKTLKVVGGKPVCA
jgi:hypothetical protein